MTHILCVAPPNGSRLSCGARPAGGPDFTNKHDVRWRTNAILPRPGAASFKRLLGSTAIMRALERRAHGDTYAPSPPFEAPKRRRTSDSHHRPFAAHASSQEARN